MARIALLAALVGASAALPGPADGARRWGTVVGIRAAPSCAGLPLRLRGGLAGGSSSCFGPTCGGRPLPNVLGFGAWQASAMPGGSSGIYLPLAGLAGLIVAGHALDGTRGWSTLTRQRVSATYFHFFMSTIIWAGTAFGCWKLGVVPYTPAARIVVFLMGAFLVMRLQRLDYERDRYKKVATFYSFAALQGTVISGLLLKAHELGLFDVIVQAAVLTAATVGSVSAIVAASPGANFMWLGGLVGAGLGLLVGANLINLIWRFSTVMHLGISYLGASVFALMLLYDTAKVVREASIPPLPTPPERGSAEGWSALGYERAQLAQFDPIKHALELYLDMVNLFLYLVRILMHQKMEEERRGSSSGSGGGGRGGGGLLSASPRIRPGGVPPLRPSGLGLR